MLRNNSDQILFKKALQNELGHENFIIKEIEQQPTSSKAEHGLSDIFRILIRSVIPIYMNKFKRTVMRYLLNYFKFYK